MNLDDWIGRKDSREEPVLPHRIAQFRATFTDLLGPGDVPPGFHWTMMSDAAPAPDLGRDGHPHTGMPLSELGLPRRMWAGGALEIVAPIGPGDLVRRDSTIADIALKSGQSGKLAFVTVNHVWSSGGEVRIRERQDIVYREPAGAGARPAPAAEPWEPLASRALTPDTILLFRFSALTFNAHRIHYDLPYATGEEGYAGLVVHGPMQAVWLLNLAAATFGRAPSVFRYRGLSPLICDGREARIEAKNGAEGLDLRVLSAAGAATMQATATP